MQNSNNLFSNDDYINNLVNEDNKRVGLLKLTEDKLFFEEYNIDKYISDIQKFGLETTWAHILNYVRTEGCNDFLNPVNFGDLYEAGLAERDKNNKKKSGQYYTPLDVSQLMAEWLLELKGENICDIGCGTGNLIISYLNLLDDKAVKTLLEKKLIYLYDFDKIAITIAQYSIALIYGLKFLNNINVIYGDFLDERIKIPTNSKIISNPPYAKYKDIPEQWTNSLIQNDSKELYAAFMEKILLSNNPGVIITPYSFLGGTKFQSLRNMLNDYNGFIVAFDNVPGNIFNGKKHGIFNTNTANSVRAAITVVKNDDKLNGFRTTPLIRFKNDEREELLKTNVIEQQISKRHQKIDDNNKMFARCHIELEDCFETWTKKSNQKVSDFTFKSKNKYTIYMPNTCRYFTTASKKKLIRGGYLTINLDDRDKFNYLYCLINSSFVYWWWRIYDGGITYPVGLFNSIPIFYELLTQEDKQYFSKVANEMILKEDEYTVTKLNAGRKQENIKFPKKYRDIINTKFLEILKCDIKVEDFDLVHKNSFFGKIDDDEDE